MNGARRLNPYDLATWTRDGDESSVTASDAAEQELGATAGSEGETDDAGLDSVAPDPVGTPEEAYDPPTLPRSFVGRFELARRTVNRSRAASRDRGLFPISASTQARQGRGWGRTAPGYSGARPDARDPQGISGVLRRVMGELGWEEGMASGRVLADWEQIVGEQVAAHCTPVSLDAGVLLVSANSSAWATQMRMLTPQLITRIHEHVGVEVISELRVTGPSARSWKKGRRTVTWRGPRDTYG